MTAIKNNSSLHNYQRYDFDSSNMKATLAFITDNEGNESTPLTRPHVYYTPEVKAKMDFVVDYCDQEVGWMGLVDRQGTDFIITEIYIPEQTVCAVETDIDEEAMHKLTAQLLAEGKDPSKLYAWYHSHVDMCVSPSTQDEEEAAEFLEMMPILIRGIVNKRGQYKVDVYYRDTGIIHLNVVAEEMPPLLTAKEEAELTTAIDDNVTERVIQTYPKVPANQGFHKPGNLTTRPQPNWQQQFQQGPVKVPIGSTSESPSGPISNTPRYGIDWDVYTPVWQRPDGWSTDPEYLAEGYDLDWDIWNEDQGVMWDDGQNSLDGA